MHNSAVGTLVKESVTVTLQELVQAWSLSPALNSLRPPASASILQAAEVELGYRLPQPLRELYQHSNGLNLLNGNLNIYPLLGNGDELSLSTLTKRLKKWQRPIRDEVLVFGDNGSDELFGIWLPTTRSQVFTHPILEIGEIFQPKCMAVAGTNLTPFLRGWTAYYLLPEGASGTALDALGVPQHLRQCEPDDELFAQIRLWADPRLPDYYADPYEHGLDAEGLARLFQE